jgi:2-polyprenyl-3-methyl-5-hydroxy-6-metoxy-1,4-benzoquinol methylase
MYRKIMYERYLSSVNITMPELEESFNTDMVLQKEIENAIPKDKNANILDLGCGYGSFLHTLQIREYKNLFGVEIGEEENRFLNSKGLNVSKLDILDFLKSDIKTYELITLFDVLEHFKKDEIVEMLPLLKKRLNDNGKLILRLPNGEAIFKGSIMYGDFTHETYFTKRSMIQLFHTFGFSRVEIYPTYIFGNTWKAKIAKLIYMSYVKLYKTLLRIDNGSSVEHFVPSQNILGIINK